MGPQDRTATPSEMVRLVLRLLRPYSSWVSIILIATLLETGMSLAAPWPLKIILDNVLGGHKAPHWLHHISKLLPGHSVLRLAALAAAASVTIALIGALASYLDNYYTERVGQSVASDLRLRLYDHLEHLPLAYFDTHKTAGLLSTLIDDIDTIQAFASSAALGILVDVFAVFGMLALMFWLNWRFALVAVAFAPILLVLVVRFRKSAKQATRILRGTQSDVLGVVQQGLESIRVVNAFGRQDLEEMHLAQASHRAMDAALKARKIKAQISPIAAITAALCTGFILWRGTALVLRSEMTIGSLTVFLSYLGSFFRPVRDLAKTTGTLTQVTVAIERVRSILDIDMRVPERPNVRDPERLKGAIQFDHVSFSYIPGAPVLKDVNLFIAPGQFVGLVGPSGAGKSTVASMIARFYDPISGTVRIDGVDICDYKLKGLRDQIAFVLQDTVLFSTSVRDNISYGRSDATDDEIIDAARLARAHEFIARMPNGYDTVLGERGLTLSGGERQRIGIARAIIRDSPILILDEPTTALDAESEKAVLHGLERLMRGRTAIAIAHRLSTVRHADIIVVLKDGLIVEQGTHDELLASRGQYAQLYRIQADAETGSAIPTAETA